MRALVIAAAAVLALAGCAAPTAPSTPQASQASAGSAPAGSAPTASAPASPATEPAAAFLARHGLEGLGVEQIVERLDAATEDRAQGPVGSVRPGELVLTDEEGQTSLPMPSDRFYLAIAPYLTRTHDCFNHNLASCQGELVDKQVQVTVTDAAGARLVDETFTTHANGFAGMWLPKDIEATLVVTYDGKSATAAIGTGADDPTCLTTLPLA